MEEYNVIQYVIPENTEIRFNILPIDRELSIKLLNGTALFQIENTTVNLPLGQEYFFSSKCLSPFLQSKSACDFIFRGNHYVQYAIVKANNKIENFLNVSLNGDSYVFVLRKAAQLQVFADDDSTRVKLEAIRGSPGICSAPLTLIKKCNLFPNTSVLVRSLDNKLCTVGIEGKNRRVKVSLIEDLVWFSTKYALVRIRTMRMMAKEMKTSGPNILVIGPPNVGKTFFCHSLLNTALEDGMQPLFIDLDVRCNTYTLPGAISLTEIKNRHYVTKDFINYQQNILQFGDISVQQSNIRWYHYLIQKMGELLIQHQKKCSSVNHGAVIDMHGMLGQDNLTINCIFEFFRIDLVVVIGDIEYYNVMTKSVLKWKECEFIPQPQGIEAQNNIQQMKFRNTVLKKYFYGKVKIPADPDVFEVRLSDLTIYKIAFSPSRTSILLAANVYFEPINCSPQIEYHVLGVSELIKLGEYPLVPEVKYFVCLIKVNLAKGTAYVLSPVAKPLSGKILIMGNIKMAANC